jgi:hypothetical protein
VASPHEIRSLLLDLHRELLQVERVRLERVSGRLTEGAFLQEVIDNPSMAWLGALTTLIALLDEVEEEEDRTRADQLRSSCVAQIRQLLERSDGEFSTKYKGILQDSPSVVVAHGALMRAIRS